METYAKALLYAIPFFLTLVLLEIFYGIWVKNLKYTLMDTVSSLSSGLTNIIKDSLGLAIGLVSYPFLLQQLSLFELSTAWWVWVLAFVFIDFAGYWNHRLSHHVNIFWNQHVIHHSSEQFNLACALRQSVSNIIGYFPLLLIPAALVGVPTQVINFLLPIHLFAQFWYHTQHIGKLGWLEWIIVTPSQHRVHHAINPEYIDKNLGQILCVWDRLFGTFQEELETVPPQYGVLKPAATWNPIVINFQHFFRMAKDAYATRDWKSKLIIWFMPTGWRPRDVSIKYPIKKIENVYQFERYTTNPSFGLQAFALVQLVLHTVLILVFFRNFSDFDGLLLFWIGFLIFLSVFSYTSVMDKHRWAVGVDVFKTIMCLASIAYVQINNPINGLLEVGWYGLALILTLCHLWVLYFFFVEFDKNPRRQMSDN